MIGVGKYFNNVANQTGTIKNNVADCITDKEKGNNATMLLNGDAGENFATKLQKAEKNTESNTMGATDTVYIVLRQMEDEETTTINHNGVPVIFSKSSLYGNTITVGGSDHPNWVSVDISCGTVKIDLNDTNSLKKCLDMFSPEDMEKIMAKITEAKMAADAEQDTRITIDEAYEEMEESNTEEDSSPEIS